MKAVQMTVAMMMAALVLVACGDGSKVSGSYADKNGMFHLIFKSNGKVTVDTVAGGGDFDYKVDGKSITMKMPQGDQVMTLQDDGTISVPGGMTLAKERAYSCTDETGPLGTVTLTAGGRVLLSDPKDASAKPEDLGHYEESADKLTIKGPDGSSITYAVDKDTMKADKISCSKVSD